MDPIGAFLIANIVKIVKILFAQVTVEKVVITIVIAIIAIFAATIVIVNIIAIQFCIMKKLNESFKTAEQKVKEWEEKRVAKLIEKEKLEREKEARKQVEAYLSVISTPIPISTKKEEIKESNKVEDVEETIEDFRIFKCIWQANIVTIAIFAWLAIVVIMTGIIIKVMTITIPVLVTIFMTVLKFVIEILVSMGVPP